jgi:hypothetical protein
MLGGSQVAASPALFSWFSAPSTASRLAGSFANASRLPGVHRCAPVCYASARAMTWSICTALLRSPRENAMTCPLYGSSRTPVRTTQSCVSGLNVASARSRARTSFPR